MTQLQSILYTVATALLLTLLPAVLQSSRDHGTCNRAEISGYSKHKVTIPSITLNNGIPMPVLGYGTWLGLNDRGEFNVEDVPKLPEVLSYAIDVGYRHIDTAHLYRVEPEIGEVVERKIKEGVCKREDLFITTKVWHHYHKAADVEVSARASLKRLKTDYVDQLLMHWPMAINEDGVDEKIDYVESWKGFEACLEKGLARSIGVSNFNEEQLKRLLENCKIKPAANQIEINLNLGQKQLVDFCQANGVAVVAYSAFGTMVPSRSYPDSPEPKMNNPVMVEIAKAHGKTVTQVTLRYLYQRGIVTIPKTLTKARVVENASIFDFELSAQECEKIAQFDNGFRTVRPSFWQDYTYYPFDKVEGQKLEIPAALLSWKNGVKQNID